LLARLTEQKEVRSVEVNKGAVATYGLLMKSMEYHPGMDDEVFNYHSRR
jgi:hypothetical protein